MQQGKKKVIVIAAAFFPPAWLMGGDGALLAFWISSWVFGQL